MTAATITDDGIDLFAQAGEDGTSPQITWVAIGTDGTTPTSGDTALGAEAFRKAVSRVDAGTDPGERLFTLSLGPSDAVGVVIAEVGWFGGSDASATPGSGVLVARGLYSHTKGVENITIVFDLSL